jgi:hypothetical protein
VDADLLVVARRHEAELHVPTATAPATTDHDVAVSHRPLALDTQQGVPDVEDQVVRLIADRNRNTNAATHGNGGDLDLRDHALLIRRQHLHRR